MSVETYLQAFSPPDYSKTEWICAVPGCDESLEKNSKSTWCKSCRTNPAAVLEMLGLPPEDEKPSEFARRVQGLLSGDSTVE
jgi:hypothetical protein